MDMIVNSIKGNDKNHYHMVLKNEEDRRFVVVGDGVYRELANPKKKNSKHIEISDIIKDMLHNKLQ